ncbi:MAG: hypothetical protein JO322_06940 [Candidatus Eremiobacteraeota bacterium]|nr:hypothetical protein [Candidatus Eremiobacteraeota bacterium]
MRHTWPFVGLLLLVPVATAASSPTPVRVVKDNVVASDRDPAVRVTVPKTATYVGTERWVLFGIANCQLFAFIDADRQKHVRRLYWVQFEGYISSMPNLHHTYDSKEHAAIGGLDFFVDAWTESSKPSRPDTTDLAAIIKSKGYAVPAGINSGSDGQHIYDLIISKGYTLPPMLSSVRFVHTLDEARKELMIIYSEPFTSSRKPTSEETRALVRRAENALVIEPV